jgi:alpha-tubulin suppressor-like RCC1 family protein
MQEPHGKIVLLANDAGQAGNNNFTNLTLPVEVGYDFTGGNEFINIATGGRHTCGVRADGNTYCWGENTFGQLGNGTTANQYLPTGITEPSIYPASEKFALSAYHTCLINQQNQLFCWGSNQDGLLGNGTEINSYVPVPVDMTNVE